MSSFEIDVHVAYIFYITRHDHYLLLWYITFDRNKSSDVTIDQSD